MPVHRHADGADEYDEYQEEGENALHLGYSKGLKYSLVVEAVHKHPVDNLAVPSEETEKESPVSRVTLPRSV